MHQPIYLPLTQLLSAVIHCKYVLNIFSENFVFNTKPKYSEKTFTTKYYTNWPVKKGGGANDALILPISARRDIRHSCIHKCLSGMLDFIMIN